MKTTTESPIMATSRALPFLYSSSLSTAHPQSSSLLLKLPAELRALIYRFIFEGEIVRLQGPNWREDFKISLRKSTFAVLQICCLMRIEAVTHLYQTALWELETLSLIFTLIAAIGTDHTKLIRKIHVREGDYIDTFALKSLRQYFGSLKIMILDIPSSFASAAEKTLGGGSLERCFQGVLDRQTERSNQCWGHYQAVFIKLCQQQERVHWSLPAIDYSLGFKVFLRVKIHGEKVSSSPSNSNNIQNADMN
jgi:hypothetical protein